MQRADAAAWYRAISKTILPHLRNRPVSFKRYIDDIGGEFFWEKDAPSFTPSWVKRFPVPRREGPPIHYIVINDVRTLTWIAEVGGIELHPFLHRIPRIDVATEVVFDLDPGEGADLRDCARVAILLRDALQTLGLESFAKVSGSKGMQVYVPLNSGATHELTETFARMLADELARRHPALIVSKMAKVLRHERVFIDWSQNADYKTTVAPYSLRAKAKPTVSMPVRWEELQKPRLKALAFDPDQALARVKKAGDLFAPVLTLRQRLPGQKRGAAAASTAGAVSASRTGRRSTQLPKPSSQSGRRLFALTRTELLLDFGGRFRRLFLLPGNRVRPDGELPIDPAYYRGEVPVADTGAYEILEGSWKRQYFALWFDGRVLQGRWTLEKRERSWFLTPG